MRLTARPALRAAVLGLLPLLAPALQAAETSKPAAATPAATKPASKPAAHPAAPRPATSRQQLKNQAKGLALATETVELITEGQLAVAARVLTGDADCEFNQKVAVKAVDGQPGHFTVAFKKAVYRMTPQETTTGAVRLEDRKAGIVWLQIPVKSMLMNSKIGQRMVDACTQPEQRAAVAAAEAADKAMKVAEAASAAAANATAASAPAPEAPPAAAEAAAPMPASAPAPVAAASATR